MIAKHLMVLMVMILHSYQVYSLILVSCTKEGKSSVAGSESQAERGSRGGGGRCNYAI